MGVLYTPANNTMTVTGYSLGTPCNFMDLYNEDKLGSLSLHARTGITGTDGAAVAVTTALRPADFVVLGGASNDLWITIANWVGTTATIRVTGTDRDSVAQTEDVVVNANGAAYVTKWFRTITHTQVTVFTATSFDYDLTQGQWGVMEQNLASFNYVKQYRMNSLLVIGDGSTATWFQDVDSQIQIPFFVIGGAYINVTDNASFQLGTLADAATKTTDGACSLFLPVQYNGVAIMGSANATVNLFSTSFKSAFIIGQTGLKVSNGKIFNCDGNKMDLSTGGANLEVYRWNSQNPTYGLFSCIGSFDKINIQHAGNCIRHSGGTAVTVTNTDFLRYSAGTLFYMLTATADFVFVDCTANRWEFNWSNSPNADAVRKYTVNLKITDKDGNGVDNATVVLKDKDGNITDEKGFSTTTNASGEISEQTVIYGYYDQANLDTLQSYSPHTVTISKPGFLTYRKSFTLDERVNWKIGLKHSVYAVMLGVE